jgi:hypothetical protein
MTQQSTPPTNGSNQNEKLQLPHPTSASAGIDILKAKSATIVMNNGKEELVIALSDGTTITVPATYENVIYLESLGVPVSRPPRSESSFEP